MGISIPPSISVEDKFDESVSSHVSGVDASGKSSSEVAIAASRCLSASLFRSWRRVASFSRVSRLAAVAICMARLK